MTPETEKMIAEINRHCLILEQMCEKLRNRNPDANHAANLALKAFDTGRGWIIEAAETGRIDPFRLDEDDTA